MQLLTPREQEIHDLLIHGLTNKQIGRELNISHRTVEDHRHQVYLKLEVSSAAEMVHQILRCRIIELEEKLAAVS